MILKIKNNLTTCTLLSPCNTSREVSTFSLGSSSTEKMHYNNYKCVTTFPHLAIMLIHVKHFQLCQVQKCCSMFRVAESVVLWSIIQSWVVVQRNPGCMPAGRGSLRLPVERWPAAGREAAEGTMAGRGCTRPGCKASGWEGSKDRLDVERKDGRRMEKIATTTSVQSK